MTCENYMLAADAMQLVAPVLGVRTIATRDNLGYPSVACSRPQT